MKTGIELIADERKRQIEKEGWTPEHDAEHTGMELAVSAAAYALNCTGVHSDYGESWKRKYNDTSHEVWPFGAEWFKPTPNDPIRQLTKAGALIAAEIDRLMGKERIKKCDFRTKLGKCFINDMTDIIDCNERTMNNCPEVKKMEDKTKFYTMKDCFDACGDDDVPFIAEQYNINPTTQKTKRQILENWDKLSTKSALSDKWQIKRAEPKTKSPVEIEKEVYKAFNELQPVRDYGLECVIQGEKNGMLKRDIEAVRPLLEILDWYIKANPRHNLAIEEFWRVIFSIPPLNQE